MIRTWLDDIRKVLYFLMLLGMLVLIGRQVWGKLPRVSKDPVPTVDQYHQLMMNAINDPGRCWICTQPWARKKFYQPDQIRNYAEWVFESLKEVHSLDGPHLTYMFAVLWQQSKLQYDAHARYNRDESGDPIKPGSNPWCLGKHGVIKPRCRPDKRLDYSIYQFNYPIGMKYGRKLYGPDFKYQSLIDPKIAIRMGVHHVKAQEYLCSDWLGVGTRKKCSTTRCYRKTGCTLTCRCKVTKRCTGVATFNGGPTTICQIARWYRKDLHSLAAPPADVVSWLP